MTSSDFLPLENVSVDDPFWNDLTATVRNAMLPYQYEALCDRVDGAEKSYCLENFRKAAAVVRALEAGEAVPVYPVDKWHYHEGNTESGAFHGWVFQDTDAYKWLEAVGYSLLHHPDDALQQQAMDCIALICAAQLPNGYLDTLYIINNRDAVFTNLRDYHELYCFGHLAEAAVSIVRATGDRRLLDAACRFADLLCDTFGEGKKRGYGGHEIAEMALVKLYDETKNERYLTLAKFLVDERGKAPFYFDTERGVKTDGGAYRYQQAHRPVRAQTEAVGHAVRGVYLYTGMAALAKRFHDDELYTSCIKIWGNIENKKLYITGGIGATVDGEAFSFNYDLPNDLAYSETCASVGLIFFARAMAENSAEARFGNVAERALYNTVLAAMSQDGRAFFYVNPLEVNPEASAKDSRKAHIKPERQKWFGCACCPPNLARLLSSLGGYAYSENDSTLFIHQYLGGTAQSRHGILSVISDYAQSGKITIRINPTQPFRLALRIPSWCDSPAFSLPFTEKNGFAYFDIDDETVLTADFAPQPRLMKCSNRVRANIGKAAVERGVFVYCLEQADNGDNLQRLWLAPDAALKYNTNCIEVSGFREKDAEALYAPYTNNFVPCTLRFIPYYRWGNRGLGEMQVYVNIAPSLPLGK